MGQTIRVPKGRRKKTPTRAKAAVQPAVDPPVDDWRQALLDTLQQMPDEAFGWLVVRIIQGQVWPEQRGGFSAESKVAMGAAEIAAKKLMGFTR
jgi:hypothetical protein